MKNLVSKLSIRQLTTLAVASGCLLAGGAQASPHPDMTPRPGAWRLEGAGDGDTVCALNLMASETIGGHDVVVSKGCQKAYPWTADITAWNTLPGRHTDLLLIDAERHVVLRLTLDDGGDTYGGNTHNYDYVLYPPLAAAAKKHRSR